MADETRKQQASSLDAVEGSGAIGIAVDGITENIVNLEWELFQDVNNAGGRAACQDMPQTFAIMRASQYHAWPEEVRESYLDDLHAAEEAKANLLAQKYAFMMKSTYPEEFASLQAALPAISPECESMIDQILDIQVPWAREIAKKYPHFASRGRPVHAHEDSRWGTSIETYLRGELSTYSSRTLALLLEHYRKARAEGVNLQEVADTFMVRCYGYDSIATAEEVMARR